MMWTYFEAHALNIKANGKTIAKLANDMSNSESINKNNLTQFISYFKKRYVSGGQFTSHYQWSEFSER